MNEQGAIPLTDLKIGETSFIHSLCSLSADQENFLINAGFVPGESVTPVFRSPSGSCTAYCLGGCVQVALRHIAAKNILVTGEAYEQI